MVSWNGGGSWAGLDWACLKGEWCVALRSSEESIVTEVNVLFVEEHAFSVL